MKTIKYILAASTAMLMMSSCDDFIDKSPLSNANANNFYNTEEELTIAMRSVYNTLYDVYGPDVELTGELGGLLPYAGTLESDDAYLQTINNGDHSGKDAISTHVGLDAGNSVILKQWQTCYKSMFKINQVISKGEAFPSIVAEARFLRALYYFDMTRTWGDVPLVLKPVQIEESYTIGRSPQSEVFDAIVEDLKFAAENLPNKKNERIVGAATSDAANALLGKVYLTMGKKDEAATALKKVTGFSLVPDFKDLWGYQNNNNEESIFEIQFLRNDEVLYSKYYTFFVPYGCEGHSTWGQSFNAVTPDLAAAMKDDPRYESTISLWKDGEELKYWFCKWNDETANMPVNYALAGTDYMVLRYADVLLMLTEATGDASYMNQVRARVGLPAISYSQEALLNERRMEFAGEFHRWFDLQRLGDPKAAIKNCSVKGGTVANVYLPIPQDVITQSPIITQNAGY